MNKNISVTFAGQAGFIFETEFGKRIGVDLYLSNCCERYFGFKRLIPYIFDPKELNLDLIVSTHAHYDHFDPDAMPDILSNEKTRLVAAFDVKNEVERLNIDRDKVTYLKEGESFKNEWVDIHALPCDHGDDTPYAIGLLIVIQNKRIYICGDTCFREDIFDQVKDIDLMIMPINGAFGNLNETEATKAVGIVKPRLCIPCHFWNFAEHGGNPYIFMEQMKENNSNISYKLMRLGETISL